MQATKTTYSTWQASPGDGRRLVWTPACSFPDTKAVVDKKKVDGLVALLRFTTELVARAADLAFWFFRSLPLLE